MNNHKYASKVHMVGRQSNMSNCYAAADVLVFPMRSAHQARPIFEAGYFSIPVVISDFPNIKEDVLNDVNGMVFCPGDSKDLASKLEQLALDKTLRVKLGIKNKEMFQKNHSGQININAINNLNEELL